MDDNVNQICNQKLHNLHWAKPLSLLQILIKLIMAAGYNNKEASKEASIMFYHWGFYLLSFLPTSYVPKFRRSPVTSGLITMT